jgi:hypothetical protein
MLALLAVPQIDQELDAARPAHQSRHRRRRRRGGNTCELRSDLDGGVHAFIEAWTEGNPAAEPSMALVMSLSALVTAAG